ncbi:competence/damage-inducible protein A [Kaarinaea lacus]
MQIGILIIGDELLSGRRHDKHMAFVIKTLAEKNLCLSWARYAGDEQATLFQNFREISHSGDICFSFGGIGATPDDLTRQSIAAAMNLAVIRHDEAAKEIEAQFGDGAYPNRILMADLPQGAKLIPNPVNRIPGFSIGHIHCLPGFPEMAWPMLKWVLENQYPQLKGSEKTQQRLKIHNAHESELIPLMNKIQSDFPNTRLSSLPRFLPDGGREIEMSLTGTEADVNAAFEYLTGQFQELGLKTTVL